MNFCFMFIDDFKGDSASHSRKMNTLFPKRSMKYLFLPVVRAEISTLHRTLAWAHGVIWRRKCWTRPLVHLPSTHSEWRICIPSGLCFGKHAEGASRVIRIPWWSLTLCHITTLCRAIQISMICAW